MKPSNYFIGIILLLSACKQQEMVVDKNAQAFEKKIEETQIMSQQLNKDYQKLSPGVKFHRDNNEAPLNPQSQFLFIAESGLPLEQDFFEWQKSHSQQEAVELYESYIEKQKGHKYLNTFKQYQGWLLLTRFDMLSNPASTQAVDYIVSELIESKFENYGLLYYSIAYLNENKANSKEKIKYSFEKISDYAKNDTNDYSKPFTNEDVKSPKPLPQAGLDLINKHRAQKAESLGYLKKIEDLSKS